MLTRKLPNVPRENETVLTINTKHQFLREIKYLKVPAFAEALYILIEMDLNFVRYLQFFYIMTPRKIKIARKTNKTETRRNQSNWPGNKASVPQAILEFCSNYFENRQRKFDLQMPILFIQKDTTLIMCILCCIASSTARNIFNGRSRH
jgi:hypothetical protein